MKEKISKRNDNFTSSIGFVLACVGSAVGLGNIWMFPYRLGEYGGAAFLIPYLIFIFLFGWVGLSAEFGLGRKSKSGTVGSYEYCFGKRGMGWFGKKIGWIPLLGSLGIAIGYAIILGWVLRTLWGFVSGDLMTADPGAYFGAILGDFGSVPWHIAVIAMTCAILVSGVSNGIEKANKILMPSFFILFLGMAIWISFLPGSGAGYEFLFVPQWDKLLNIKTWIMAMGQAFFSLSISGSSMIVYGSYIKKDVDIPEASLRTAGFDTCAAMISALAIMPAVFAYGIGAGSGPVLVFLTLPKVFQQMPFGQFFAIIFFVAVLFAGITSLINLLEAPTEHLQENFTNSRKAASIITCVLSLAVGIFIESEPKVGAWMDFISVVIVPFGAVMGAATIYYILGWDELRKELEIGHGKMPEIFGLVGKYVYVPLTIIIMVLGLMYGGL